MLHRAGVDMRPVLRRSARPVLAAVVAGVTMAVIALPLHSAIAQLTIAGGLGCVVYAALALSAQDRSAVRDLLLPKLLRRRGATA
jgi:hypothetical protein